MARPRRRFGPLLYGTLILAVMVLIGIGGLLCWPLLRDAWRLHALSRQLRNPSSSPLLRGAAANELLRLGEGAEAVWVQALQDPNEEVRILACRNLCWLSGVSKARTETFLRALTDRSTEVRRMAVSALGAIGRGLGTSLSLEQKTAIVGRLRSALLDNDGEVRHHAAMALAQFPTDAADAIADLKFRLEDSEPAVRCAAAETLLKIGHLENGPAIATLHSLILDAVSPGWNPAFPSMSCEQIFATLNELAPVAAESLLPTLIGWLHKPDRTHQYVALDCLATLGPRARSAIPAIENLLEHPDLRVGEVAARTIIQIDVRPARRAIEVLRGMSKNDLDGSEYLRLTIPQDVEDSKAKSLSP